MDENVIFIYPLNSILTHLKDELEKDENFTVFEIDMLEEYEQLIENLESSITFSFDPKKTLKYLELTNSVVTRRTHQNILISKQAPTGLMLSRMQRNGLNEYLPEYVQLKALMLKINFFFKTVSNYGGKELSISTKTAGKIDNQTSLRIERLVENQKIKKSIDINEDKDKDDIFENGITLEPIELHDKEYLSYLSSEKTKTEVLGSNFSTKEIWSKRRTPEVVAALELPEISFFPGSRVLDSVAFFMEILFNHSDANIKKKYLKMSLMKVYKTQFYVADQDGLWEEGAPEQLKLLNISDFTIPTWINEGRNTDENIFVLPIFLEEKFNSVIALVIAGAVGHDKMAEMEFWCYLGRCACS